jgi:hypothetical protein
MACIRFVVLVVVVALTSGQTPRDSGDSWALIPGLIFNLDQESYGVRYLDTIVLVKLRAAD